ncbi:MAG: four helix bundle protein [Pirellulales bacterium]
MAFAFEKLQVYQKAITFADKICTLTRDLPRGYFFLADQLNHAALSIAPNITEDNGRYSALSADRGTMDAVRPPCGHRRSLLRFRADGNLGRAPFVWSPTRQPLFSADSRAAHGSNLSLV